MPDRWILAYSSLLTLQARAAKFGLGNSIVPCKLRGWTRDWRAARMDNESSRKRFVTPHSYMPAPEYAFASIHREDGCWLNAVAVKVRPKELLHFDQREVGYVRMDITDDLEAAYGFDLPDGRVEAYVDAIGGSIEVPEAPVSAGYASMGEIGARGLDPMVPGFHRDYLDSTPPPPSGFSDLDFIHFGPDARALWRLEFSDDTRVCLGILRHPMDETATMAPEDTAYWNSPRTVRMAKLDMRDPALLRGSRDERMAHHHPSIRALHHALGSASLPEGKSYWTERFAYLCDGLAPSADPDPAPLARDPDAWVRAAAQGALRARALRAQE